MVKRLQIALTEEAWANVQQITKDANDGFDGGHVTWSDTINEIAENAKIDVKQLQLKHLNLRKSLRSFAKREDVDLDSVIKSLLELKAQKTKKRQKPSPDEVA